MSRGARLRALTAISLLAMAGAWPADSQADPPPAGQEVKSVSCASTTMCIAVGKTGGKHSVVERWEGTDWSLVGSTDGEIRKISCASTTACMAVGVSAGGIGQSWGVFELSGTWVVLELPPPMPIGTSEAALNDVDCVATVCTAVGFYKSGSLYFPLVERWSGSAWSQQFASSPLEGGPNVMLGVSCTSETSCVSVGEAGGKPFTESWNGGVWLATLVANPSGATGAKLASVSCTSSSFCMGVGDYFETASKEKTLVERWDGSTWSIVSSPNPSEAKGYVNLADVSCQSSTSCFAVGYYATTLLSTAPLDLKTLVERWNGSTWTIQPSPGATGQAYNALLGVSCTSVSACTAVGSFTNTLLGAPSPLAERWNGTEWSVQTVVPPVAVNDSATVTEDAPATAIAVLANDSEAVAGSTEIVAKTDGAHGTVAITGGGTGLTYQPAANYCGADSFTYELNGGSAATVSVTVTCVDDPPVAVNDSQTLTEDAGPTAIEVLSNDTDIDGGPKEIASKTEGSHGTVNVLSGGIGLTYTPAANYCGPDSFTYTLNGGSTATVSITVTCVDDPPVAVNDTATVSEDAGAGAIDVLVNDTDIDGGPKSIASVAQPAHGSAAITGGGTGLTYQPAANYCGADSFTYELNGGSAATVSVTVTCVDDPPVAANDSETVLEDSPPAVVDVLINDTDSDEGPKLIAARTNGAHGTVAIIGAGSGLTYTPAPDYCGADSFTYTLNGGSTATVSITVTCVDDPAPEGGGGGGGGGQSGTTVIQQGSDSTGPVVNITPGVGVVSGRRHPRIAIKGSYAFFTLTCKVKEGDCAGTVTITASIPSVTLGPTNEKLELVKGKFRIGAGRSVLVRAKLTKRGREALQARPTLRGVAGHMAIVDTTNGEHGEIDVNLVRRPKASLLSEGAK